MPKFIAVKRIAFIAKDSDDAAAVARLIDGETVYIIGPLEVGLGDKIASNPIVHAIGKATGCVDPQTNQLKPESGCGKMKARLNAGMSVTEAMKLRLQGK